jgi:uncharacterized protein
VTFLLDVNVLIALIDPNHVGHDTAHEWFREMGAVSWATCDERCDCGREPAEFGYFG